MVVATVDETGQPYQRIVLLKHYDEKGLVFYTNLGSRKAHHIEQNPAVSLLFPAHAGTPVMVTGKAERLSTLEVVKYFHSRPRDSQIGASGLQTVQPDFRARYHRKVSSLSWKQKFQQGEIPLPSFWGGYRVSIEQMEFWQGGANRLHDRFLYQRENDAWKIDRLAP